MKKGEANKSDCYSGDKKSVAYSYYSAELGGSNISSKSEFPCDEYDVGSMHLQSTVTGSTMSARCLRIVF